MKQKKKWKWIFPCILTVCICGGMAMAAYNVTIHNMFRTDGVVIELNTFQKDKTNQESMQTELSNVLPGQKISTVPRITNCGADCYVRAKVFYDLEGMEQAEYGLGKHWEAKEDGYYYYTEKLARGQETDIFEGFQLPTDGTSEEYANRTFHQNITVDSIQSDNFTPDWDSSNPWGNVEIQKNTKTAQEFSSITQNQSFQISFDGSSKNLFANAEDFFANFGTLMPGDVLKETVILENNSEETKNLYFSQARSTENLLKAAHLEISVNGQKVVEGNLADDISHQLLAKLPANTKKEMTFVISIPEELDNTYALQEEQIDWTFAADDIKQNGNKSFVQTGDKPVLFFSITTALLLAGGGFVILKRKKSEN